MGAEPSDVLYLEHIHERLQRIEACAREGREAYEASHVLQDAIIRNVEVIGEAVKRLSPALLQQYPEVPWRRIAGFRDVLIHNYMGVDLDEVWNVIEKDLPRVKETVQAMQEESDA